MNPYQILGVSPSDSEDAIKKAYRKAAKECHPDTHPGDRQAEERFKEVGEAYRILSDRQKIKEYDEKTAQKKQWESVKSRKRTASGAGPIYPGEIEKEFEKFFSTGNKNRKQGTGKQQNINPMDVSDLFERYMGLKR